MKTRCDMSAMLIDCDECNAEAGEPCREWCIGEAEERECTHSLCVEGTRRWPATHVITQVWREASGEPVTRETYTCKTHTKAMSEILREGDTVERLHGDGE